MELGRVKGCAQLLRSWRSRAYPETPPGAPPQTPAGDLLRRGETGPPAMAQSRGDHDAETSSL
jgi:hypothetical protein